MKAAGLRGKTKRRFKTTTISKHQRPRAENLLKQNFEVPVANSVWASDITYVATGEGWLYLAVTLDLFSRKVVGWSFSERLTDDLTLWALSMATRQRSTAATLHHSDRGAQYASHAFRNRLKANRITQSMSGKGNCYGQRSAEACRTTQSLNRSSPPLKPRRSTAHTTEPARRLKPASSVTLKVSITPSAGTLLWGFYPPTILRGYTSLKLLNCDSVKAGKDQVGRPDP